MKILINIKIQNIRKIVLHTFQNIVHLLGQNNIIRQLFIRKGGESESTSHSPGKSQIYYNTRKLLNLQNLLRGTKFFLAVALLFFVKIKNIHL